MSESLSIECIGLACPGPILRCKEAIEHHHPAAIDVTVDNEAARQNVLRFLKSNGYDASSTESGGLFVVRGERLERPRASAPPAEAADSCEAVLASAIEKERIVVFITAETIGKGDDALGAKLMGNFLGTLPELGHGLWRVILVNGAVKMSSGGHPALEKLQALVSGGVSLLVCGTCLDHFGLLERKMAGETTNMLDVVTSLQLASKVIQI